MKHVVLNIFTITTLAKCKQFQLFFFNSVIHKMPSPIPKQMLNRYKVTYFFLPHVRSDGMSWWKPPPSGVVPTPPTLAGGPRSKFNVKIALLGGGCWWAL